MKKKEGDMFFGGTFDIWSREGGTYRYIPVVIMATLGVLREAVSPGAGGSIKKDIPTQSRKMASQGNVKISNGLRPNLSIVKNAGSANTQFRIPVPIEARRALLRL